MLKWLYNKLYPKQYSTEIPVQSDKDPLEAIRAAHEDLAEAYRRRPVVEALLNEAELIRARNGFSTMVAQSMEKRDT